MYYLCMFLTEQTQRRERACLIIIYLTLYFSCKNGNTCPYKPVIWIFRIRSYILWQKNITYVMGKIILQQRTRSLILSTHIRGLGRPRSIWLKSICPPGTNDIFFLLPPHFEHWQQKWLVPFIIICVSEIWKSTWPKN